MGIILGLTSVVTAQSPETKPAEEEAAKPATKPVEATPVKIVKAEKPVSPEKMAKSTTTKDAPQQAKPATKVRSTKPDDTEVSPRLKEKKQSEEKENN